MSANEIEEMLPKTFHGPYKSVGRISIAVGKVNFIDFE
jgi:hypothetical protein